MWATVRQSSLCFLRPFPHTLRLVALDKYSMYCTVLLYTASAFGDIAGEVVKKCSFRTFLSWHFSVQT
jgi:hypothetical protein